MMPDTFHNRNGLRVGHYFVYATDFFVDAQVHEGRVRPPFPWGVMHLPTGVQVTSCRDFGEALVIADEFSLQYSTETQTHAELVAGVPHTLGRWAEYCINCINAGEKFDGFRKWKGLL